MLPPGWRVFSVPRTRLAWLRAIANELFGAAMAYVESHGRGPVSSVRNALLTCWSVLDRGQCGPHVAWQVGTTRWATLAVVARTAVRASTSCSTPSWV